MVSNYHLKYQCGHTEKNKEKDRGKNKVGYNILNRLIAHISDKKMIHILEFLKIGIGKKRMQEHYRNNSEEWKQNKCQLLDNGIGFPYIERQKLLKDFEFGYANAVFRKMFFGGNKMMAADNCCEVIAVYNAITFLGNGVPSIDFPVLLKSFEHNGIVLHGCFGISPKTIYKYFGHKGYNVHMLVGEDINESSLCDMQESHDTYILTAYNEKGHIESMIHTVSITIHDGKYYIHNSSDDRGKAYDTLHNAVEGFGDGRSDAICVIGVS